MLRLGADRSQAGYSAFGVFHPDRKGLRVSRYVLMRCFVGMLIYRSLHLGRGTWGPRIISLRAALVIGRSVLLILGGGAGGFRHGITHSSEGAWPAVSGRETNHPQWGLSADCLFLL